jgi:hypothetical protein
LVVGVVFFVVVVVLGVLLFCFVVVLLCSM